MSAEHTVKTLRLTLLVAAASAPAEPTTNDFREIDAVTFCERSWQKI